MTPSVAVPLRVGLLSAIAAGGAVWALAGRPPSPCPAATPPAPPSPPSADALRSSPPTPAPVPDEAPPPAEPLPPDLPPVHVATDCDHPAALAGYAEPTTPAQTQALAALVADWRAGHAQPRVAYRRGVVFAESEEDRGDDPPYPRSAAAESRLVCGTDALWLRAAARDAIAHAELHCCGNVCGYDGMEYVPSGTLVFRAAADGQWELAAWTETFHAALASAYAEANTRFVARALARLRDARCPGEPPGAY